MSQILTSIVYFLLTDIDFQDLSVCIYYEEKNFDEVRKAKGDLNNRKDDESVAGDRGDAERVEKDGEPETREVGICCFVHSLSSSASLFYIKRFSSHHSLSCSMIQAETKGEILFRELF